jgi:hypothetical protein
MSGLFDDAEIPIPCPKCGRETQKSVGWIKSNDEFTCDCGQVIRLEADDFRRGIEESEDALEDLKRKLQNQF